MSGEFGKLLYLFSKYRCTRLLQHADFLLALQMNEEQYQKVSIYNVKSSAYAQTLFGTSCFTDSFSSGMELF